MARAGRHLLPRGAGDAARDDPGRPARDERGRGRRIAADRVRVAGCRRLRLHQRLVPRRHRGLAAAGRCDRRDRRLSRRRDIRGAARRIARARHRADRARHALSRFDQPRRAAVPRRERLHGGRRRRARPVRQGDPRSAAVDSDRSVRRADRADAQAVFVSCTDFRALEVAAELESCAGQARADQQPGHVVGNLRALGVPPRSPVSGRSRNRDQSAFRSGHADPALRVGASAEIVAARFGSIPPASSTSP